MKRVLVLLVAGTALSGAAAVYATATAPALDAAGGKIVPPVKAQAAVR